MPKTPSEGSYQFGGFVAPRYTPTPDQIFDELLAPGRLTEAELRVLLYIVRRTFGWKKDCDAISLSQITDGIIRRDGERLDWGAGIAKSSAVRAVKGLVGKGIILAERHSSRERGFEATTYSLRLRDPLSADETRPVPPLSVDETRGHGPLSSGETRASASLSAGETRETIANYAHETRASIRVEPALVAPRNKQETSVQETVKQEPDSNRNTPSKNEVTPGYSPYIAGILMDFSQEWGDSAHSVANVSQGHNLWYQSGLTEGAFVQHLYAARQKTQTAQGRQGRGVIANRMAYFFTVVRDGLSPGGSADAADTPSL